MPAWDAVPPRVFLLSPASASGARCRSLLAPGAGFELARRVRDESAPLGEVMSFLSALYFRGKLAYAQRFATPLARGSGVLVITAGRGLLAPETPVTGADLRAFARVAIDAGEPRYVDPLRSDARRLRAALPQGSEVVLLGSIATPKYVDVLLAAFGPALLFPRDFVGRGDMSRGGLLLRAARAGEELAYHPVDGAVRRGARPARLVPLRAPRARAERV
jgi:hypothetical protein